MANSNTFKIVVTGDFCQTEFRNLFQPRRGLQFELMELDELLNLTEPILDALVVAQSRRGQFTDEAIVKLWNRFPLAQRILLYGSWCEGETRSGNPVSGIRRIHLQDWSAWLENGLSGGQSETSFPSGIPVSYNRADELMNAGPEEQDSLPELHLLVANACPDFFGTIQSFAESKQWRAERLDASSMTAQDEPARKPDLLICECFYSVDEATELLDRLPYLKRLPIVVVLGFPRQQDRQALRAMAIEFALLGKPFGNEVLRSSIRGLLQNRKLNVVSDVA